MAWFGFLQPSKCKAADPRYDVRVMPENLLAAMAASPPDWGGRNNRMTEPANQVMLNNFEIMFN